MSGGLFFAAHDLRRLTEIAGILIAHGFGDLVRQLGIDRLIGGIKKATFHKQAAPNHSLAPEARLRLALEELGPTFVKLGQILSTRADLLPPAYIAELGHLRDKVRTLDWADLIVEVEAELGIPLAEAFDALDTTPLAAGSIAQVHRARLKTGEDVVLKIRRPGIVPVIEADLRLIGRLASLAETEGLSRFRPVEIATEFARSLRSELDLANECRNAERVAASFADDPNIRIPTVHWQWSRENMNVQSHVSGLPGSDLTAVRAAGLDLTVLARRGADAVLKMIFADRFYHADPHPGNVFYGPGNEISFIDFGMVGQLTRQRRDELVDLLFGVVEKRADKVAGILLRWAGTDGGDVVQLAAEVERFIDRVHGVPLGELHLSGMISDLVAVMREHHLALPYDLTMLIKAFISLEGMGRELDPGFDMISAAQPFLEDLVWQRRGPQEWMRRTREGIADGFGLMTELPHDLRKLLDVAQTGRLKLHIELDQGERYLKRLDRLMARLTMGIVIAALTIGSSIVMAASGDELSIGVSIFALLGFFGAVLGGVWLLWAIWRDR
ncbi:ABC1 kinase family protein [Celeribacter persicus]|uniref:2-octaprenylphenol hydroxylase n=1 Tax=Celeribacter persicus TaxID=1651082 RepID=A0A2T5H0G2_9RHOB|nr:AarF/UbiB family protein [Celeribacter persicus]PTQ65072.1 2-octaprenylphenol hydroxylase [Celeribacter persicus]